MARVRWLLGALLACAFVANLSAALMGTALVRHAPTLNGGVEGSIQQMTAENTTLNGGASVTGDLLLPGTPTVQLNGNPTYGGTLDGTGVTTPSSHKVTLNGGASLGHVVRRTDAVSLPTVPAPPLPAGTRSVSLNNAAQSPGDFATLKNLTLNSNVGPVVVPPGTYGNFNANAGSGFTLGVAGATTPAVYNFQNLTLNSNSTFTVVGPVVVTLNGGFSTNTTMGAVAHPEWLKLRIAGGGLSLASNKIVYAHLEAPDGTLTLNGSSQLIGALTSDRLIVNGNALLRLLAPPAYSGLPFLANFELAEGYQPGALQGQNGWTVTGAATVGTALRYAGAQGVTVAPATPPALLIRAFANSDPRVTFVDLFALPAAAATPDAGVFFETDAAEVALTGVTPTGLLQAFNGDGAGSGSWTSTGTGPALDATGRSADWLRLTARADYAAKRWDLYFNGRMIAADLGFVHNPVTAFSGLALSGHATLPTGFDDLLISFENPLFVDADQDGMEDVWETAHGLNPALNDRNGDLDGDGITNLREYLIGTSPNSPDTDGDGLTDGYELGHGLNPALADGGEDSDHDGLTNLQEYQLGTDPHNFDTDGDGLPDALEVALGYDPLHAQPGESFEADADGDGLTLAQEFLLGTNPLVADDLRTGGDTDGDGLTDRWEMAHGLNPQVMEPVAELDADADQDDLTLIQEARAGTNPANPDTDGDGMNDGYELGHGLNPLVADGALDPDLDGLTNLEEYRRGSDPADYYNGIDHEILPFIGGEAGLGADHVLAVRVTDRAGTPLVNAPVTFAMNEGDSLITLTPGGPSVGRTAEVRTGPGGIARIYLKAP